MKKSLSILMVVIAIRILCGCAVTHVEVNAPVTLVFMYADKNIHATLTADEAKKVVTILNRKTSYPPALYGFPSCGFDENISLVVNGHIYAIACDGCDCVEDCKNSRFFNIPGTDMQYIHSLFEKYGGHFPCV